MRTFVRAIVVLAALASAVPPALAHPSLWEGAPPEGVWVPAQDVPGYRGRG